MFNFAYPENIYLFLIIPIIVVIYWLGKRMSINRLKKFGNLSTLSHLMPDVSKYIPNIKLSLQLIALVALIFALCRPRHGEKEETSTQAGNEVYIAIDVSNSMLASATDDPNGTSRLVKAKLLLEKLIEKLSNDKVGLIIYAGEAYMQLPITSDYISAKQYLDVISPDMIPSQGTAIADAIELAMNNFTADETKHKALILITDAEDHVGEAIDMAKNAAKQNIQIDVIGLGSSKGAPIPINKDRTQFMTDYNGEIVNTALNEKLAQELADAGKGIYVNGSSSSALSSLTSQLDKLSKSELKTVKYKATAEQFPLFVWIALIILIIDVFILNKKVSWLKDIKFFSKD